MARKWVKTKWIPHLLAKTGYHYSYGAQILLDRFDEESASLLEVRRGITDTTFLSNIRVQEMQNEGISFDSNSFTVGSISILSNAQISNRPSRDGTAYCGWQRQPNCLSIQQVVESALQHIFPLETIKVQAAGRTDAGVHVLNQIAAFSVENEREPSIILRGLNAFVKASFQMRK